jgi:hypothetical protein
VGLWGLIPDIIHFFGWLPKEDTRTAVFDVFFFHSSLEYIENTNSQLDDYLNLLGEFFLVAVALGTMVYYVIQIKKASVAYREKKIKRKRAEE